jgi:hypothetical protein
MKFSQWSNQGKLWQIVLNRIRLNGLHWHKVRPSTAPLVLNQALSLHTYFTHFLPTGRLAVQNTRGSSFPKFTGQLKRQRWCNWQLHSCPAASLPRVPWSEWRSRSQMEVLTAAGRICVAQQLLRGICRETNGFTLSTESSWYVYGPFLTSYHFPSSSAANSI